MRHFRDRLCIVAMMSSYWYSGDCKSDQITRTDRLNIVSRSFEILNSRFFSFFLEPECWLFIRRLGDGACV